jgi:splicing factor 3B subunit 3
MAISPMPNRPVGITTLKGKISDVFDKYMIVSFQNSTLVLTIGEDKVAEDKFSGFYNNERTIHAGILEDNSYV